VQTLQWAVNGQARDGSLLSGKDIACQHGRHERWGMLVKRAGLVGGLGIGDEQAA
jgi:hypothetical protein